METFLQFIIALSSLGTSGFFLKRFVAEIDQMRSSNSQQHKDTALLIEKLRTEIKSLNDLVHHVRTIQGEKDLDIRTEVSRVLLMLDRASEKIKDLHETLDSSKKKSVIYDEILKTLIKDWTQQKKDIASLRLTLGKTLMILKDKKNQ